MTVISLKSDIADRINATTNASLRTTIQQAFAEAGDDLTKLQLLDGILSRSARGRADGVGPIGAAIFYSGDAPDGRKNLIVSRLGEMEMNHL